MRNRLLALLLVATIPVVAIAGANALAAYETARAAPLATALLLREAAAARHITAIEGAHQLLAALSRMPTLNDADPEQCDRVLADILALGSERYSNIWVMEPDGRLRCGALSMTRWENFAHLAWFREALEQRRFSLGDFITGLATGRVVITASYPVMQGDRLARIVALGLRQDYLLWNEQRPRPDSAGTPHHVWLMDEAGRLASGSASDLLPPEAELRRLAGAPHAALQATARNGAPFAYAATLLADDLRLIVGYPAGRDLAAARGLLQQRIAELSFFLLVCLGAVLFGLDRSVVLPIRRIAAAVESWRGGRAFAPGELATVPTEIRQLAETFADATARLAEREQQLRDALAHRDMLLREVNHRVKNNLQVVASLLNLQAGRLRNPEAQSAFAAARDRVRALSTLHRHLYMHEEGTRIEVKAFLTELAETLFASLGESSGQRITLEIEAPTLQLQSDQAVPLALLTTEALTNALKYAFPSGRHGTVWLELKVEGSDAMLRLCDDGVGLEHATEDPNSTGIGTELIGAFAQQIGGTLDIGARPGGGTVLTVRFPVAPAVAAAPIPA